MSHAVVHRLHRPLVLRAIDALAEAWRRIVALPHRPARVDPADQRLMRDLGLGEFAQPSQFGQREGGGWTSGGWRT